MKLNSLHGDILDRAVAIALGWKRIRTKDIANDYFETEERPVFLSNWQPSQSARQCMRLMIEQKISAIYNEETNKWTAITRALNGTLIESSYKRPHEAICRAFITKKELDGVIFDSNELKE
jgi:Protein of unknown function (DUF2591)